VDVARSDLPVLGMGKKTKEENRMQSLLEGLSYCKKGLSGRGKRRWLWFLLSVLKEENHGKNKRLGEKKPGRMRRKDASTCCGVVRKKSPFRKRCKFRGKTETYGVQKRYIDKERRYKK